MSIVRRVLRKLDYLAGKTYMHGTMGTDPEVIKKEGLRSTRSTGRTDTAVSLHMHGEHPDNVFMTTNKKTAAQYSGGDLGHVVKIRFPRSVHRALVKSGKLKRDSIETTVPELDHQKSWMHQGDVSPEYIHSIGKMKSFKSFVKENKKLVEADLLNITKKYPGGHVGKFRVNKFGVMTHKLIPAGRDPAYVHYGDRHDPKEIPPNVGVNWMYNVSKKYMPRALKAANVTGHEISLKAVTPKLKKVYSRGFPKGASIVKSHFFYKPNRKKISLSGLKDAASWVARSGIEKVKDNRMVQNFLEKRKAKRMSSIKEAWIHIKKPLSGGHTGHFIVRDDGHVSQRIVPKGREFNDVDDGSTFHSSEVSPHTSAAWMLHVRRRLLPDAMHAADESGKTLIAAPGSERQGDLYDSGLPKEFERGKSVAGFRSFIYRGRK